MTGTHQSTSRVTAPPWAPHYPYVRALQGPSAPSKKKPAESLAEEVEDLMNFGSGHLSAAVIQVLDRLEEAFRRSDPQSMMEAVSELGLRGGFEESLLASRGAELLEASNAERSGSGSGRDRGLKASPNPKLAALEAEILRRFGRAFAQQPERSRAFVDEGLPEPLLEPLRRQRMLRAVRAMTAPKSAPVTAPARERSEGSEGSAARSRGGGYSGCQPDHLPAQRAVSSYHLASKDQAQLSQAVLELPWSGNEKWERRWEQENWTNSTSALCVLKHCYCWHSICNIPRHQKSRCPDHPDTQKCDPHILSLMLSLF